MSKAFFLKEVGGPFGDQTSNYELVLYKELTVREFVEQVLSDKREWGTIHIYNPKGKTPWECRCGGPQCEYSHGRLVSVLPDEILDKVIVSGRSNGGWSLMDYCLTLAE